jgi:hypothetical protein
MPSPHWSLIVNLISHNQEAVVATDLSSRMVYLAWKPSGQKIKVNPPVKTWPERRRRTSSVVSEVEMTRQFGQAIFDHCWTITRVPG